MIQDENLKEFTKYLINRFEKYFFFVPSSSTGKYHSEQSNVVGSSESTGGLVNHTKAVVYFSDILCRAYDITGKERDAIIIASICHDGQKYSSPMQKYTTKTHGTDFANVMYKQGLEYIAEGGVLTKEELYGICSPVAHHMGRFSVGPKAKKFPEEYTKAELIVHLSDMCSSGKEVRLDFLDAGNLIG